MLGRRSNLVVIVAGLASLCALSLGASFLPIRSTPSLQTVTLAAPRQPLSGTDEVAALEMVQYALSEVGDGKTYVWRRWHGKLSGIVQPTASFKATGGKVCRHLLVLMTAGTNTKKHEGLACRLPTGRWQLGD